MKKILHLALILPMAALCLWSGIANAQSDNRTVEQRAAQALMNTIKGKEVNAPSPGRIKEFREQATSDAGDAWAVTDQVKSSVDEKKISVTLKINHLPEDYKPDPDATKKWKSILQPQRHAETNAEIGFRVSKRGDVRRHRIYYRVKEGNIGLLMHVTRTGDETVDEAIQKTTNQFSKFYKFAKKEGLVGFGSSLDLAYLPEGGGQIEINDQVQVVQAPNTQGQIDMEFDVAAVSAAIQPGKDYEVELQIESKTPPATLLSGNRRALNDSDGNGWKELTVRADSRGRFVIRLAPFQPSEDDPYGMEQLVIASVRVRTNSPESAEAEYQTIRFGIQRRSWHVIAQRFELAPGNYFRTDQKTKNSQGGVYELDGRLGFNKLVGKSGLLLENYEEMLRDFGTPRGEIPESQAVAMGWEREHASEKAYQFYVASDKKDREDGKEITAIPVGHRIRAVIDLKIVRAPKRTTLTDNKPPQLDEFGDPIESEESVDFDVLSEEREIRKLVTVENYTLTRTLIADAPGEDEETFKKNLPARLRIAPDREKKGRLVKFFDSKGSRMDAELDTHFPLTNRYKDPNSLPEFREPSSGGVGLLIDNPHRFAGVYELRFTANLRLDGETPGIQQGESDDADKPDIDIAFRYAVCPQEYETLLLQWSSERGRLIDQ